jgi:hypothetical protein
MSRFACINFRNKSCPISANCRPRSLYLNPRPSPETNAVIFA